MGSHDVFYRIALASSVIYISFTLVYRRVCPLLHIVSKLQVISVITVIAIIVIIPTLYMRATNERHHIAIKAEQFKVIYGISIRDVIQERTNRVWEEMQAMNSNVNEHHPMQIRNRRNPWHKQTCSGKNIRVTT